MSVFAKAYFCLIKNGRNTNRNELTKNLVNSEQVILLLEIAQMIQLFTRHPPPIIFYIIFMISAKFVIMFAIYLYAQITFLIASKHYMYNVHITNWSMQKDIS